MSDFLLYLAILISALLEDFFANDIFFLLLKDIFLAYLIDLILSSPLCFFGMLFATFIGCGFTALTSFLIAISLIDFSGFNKIFYFFECGPDLNFSLELFLFFLLKAARAGFFIHFSLFSVHCPSFSVNLGN